MKKNRFFTLHPSLFVLAALSVLLLTSCAIDKNMKKGEKYLALGEYYDAANEFKRAYSKTSPKDKEKRGERALKMAHCYERSLQTQKAIAAYKNAIRYNVATPEHRLNYARLLLKNGEYKNAINEFNIVLDSLPGNKLALAGIESAKNAPEIKQLGSRYTVKKMDVFNSRRAEYSPALFGDQYDQLYFTSTRNEAEGDELSGITGTKPADIFVSTKDDKGKWSKPEQVQGGLNTAYDEGACTFSPDGREMYLTQCVEDASYPRYAQIVKSSRSDASWGKVSEVKITNDTLTAYAHPAISPDNEWLYFVSDMPGGKGGLDIWRVRFTSAGMGGVENLGSPINTEGDEMFPVFRPNGDFYFSSNGHPGLGGLDIFIAKVGDDRKYHLEHPGYPLNSQGDDFGMTFEGPYNRGFFSSNRGDGRGWDHIYSFDNPEIVQNVVGWVYEQDGYELHEAEVFIVANDGTNQRIGVKSDGSFSYQVTPGVDYLFLATCKGYLNHKEELSVKQAEESEEYTLQFALPSISSPVLIENIFYDFDKATLREESTEALDKLVEMLNENPNITIELAAHCDSRGADAYNKRLSQKRAESVVNYLLEHGIAPERLTPVGYGEERPKKVKKKLTEKLPWLKEGEELTEEFISKLDEEKQEACHQLNRRTEFRVLRTTYGMFDENGNLKENMLPKKKVETSNSSDEDFEIDF
ncbi:MAG: OmpA family protein [Prevotellaceae bacterium]|nr:OmpA family protein [Prevotellaceae bacterium]